MSHISSDSNKNLFITTLTSIENILYKAERKFYLENGYSAIEAEAAGWRKVQNVRNLKNDRTILRR